MTALAAGDGATDQQKTAFGVDTRDNEVLCGPLAITQMSGHTLARENTTRILAVTDGTRSVCRNRVTVAGAVGTEMMTFDDTGESLTDCRSRHVNLLTGGKHRRAQNRAGFEFGDFVRIDMELF